MVSKKVTIKNPTGLHLRPAGILCNEAIKYRSKVTFGYCGGEIELICEGIDEQEALDGLTGAIDDGLGE